VTLTHVWHIQGLGDHYSSLGLAPISWLSDTEHWPSQWWCPQGGIWECSILSSMQRGDWPTWHPDQGDTIAHPHSFHTESMLRHLCLEYLCANQPEVSRQLSFWPKGPYPLLSNGLLQWPSCVEDGCVNQSCGCGNFFLIVYSSIDPINTTLPFSLIMCCNILYFLCMHRLVWS